MCGQIVSGENASGELGSVFFRFDLVDEKKTLLPSFRDYRGLGQFRDGDSVTPIPCRRFRDFPVP